MTSSSLLPDTPPSIAAPAGFGQGRPVVMQIIPRLETGGAERGCVDVAAAVVQAGGTALVVSQGGPMTHELGRRGAGHITLSVASKNPLTIWRNTRRLTTLIRQHQVDILHVRSRAPGWSALWAARRTGIPLVTTFHAPYGGEGRLKRLYNSVMARGDRVIAVSQFIFDHVTKQYGINAERLRLIHRGIDTETLAPERVSHERMIKLAREWRLPEDQRIILLPGRLTRWKGHTVLIEALRRLNRPDVRLVLVGGDQGRAAYRRELEGLINLAGLGGQVTIAGHCTDMAAAYMLADVVVSASVRPEAFGRVIVEAQAMGRPVVVSALGASAETVIHGETGLVVPPNDPDALAAALEQALALDTVQRRALAVDAIRFVRERFTRLRMCAETLEVYAELLAARVR